MGDLEWLKECACRVCVIQPLNKLMVDDLVIVIPPEPVATFLAEHRHLAREVPLLTRTSPWWSERLPNCL